MKDTDLKLLTLKTAFLLALNQGTYRLLLYPFVYIETENDKALASVLLFYGFKILLFCPLPNDQLQLGKLYNSQDVKCCKCKVSLKSEQ